MKSRVITALVILAVLLPLIYLSILAFKIMASALVILVTHEFFVVKKERKYHPISQVIIYLINVLPLWIIADFSQIGGLSIAIYLLIFYSLMVFDKKINFEDLSYILAFSIFVVVAANSALFLRYLDQGFFIVVFVIIVTAAADTGAFFVGSYFGKHKLIPRISPNKSVEGVVGGVVGAICVGVIFYYLFDLEIGSLLVVSLISFVLGLFACLGDLFFSAIKRTYQIKDFSSILPGHGGIADRVDSHFTNLIVFFIIYMISRGI